MNVIASALLAETPKLLCTALNFFLNIDTQMADDDDDEIKAETAPSEVGTAPLYSIIRVGIDESALRKGEGQ